MAFLEKLTSVGANENAALLRALLGGPQRLSDLVAKLGPSAEEPRLAGDLRDLDAEGLVSRRVEKGPPLRVLYELTAEGTELAPAISTIATWAERRRTLV